MKRSLIILDRYAYGMIFRMITKPLFLGLFPPYALILSISGALGLGLSIWLGGERRELLVNTGVGILAVGLLGARIGYGVQNLAFFLEHVGQLPQFWLGGLTWPGALIGAGVGLWGISRIWEEDPGDLADSYLPLLGAIAIAIWLTGWGAGIGYGPQTEAWFGIPVRDFFGTKVFRWPLPIIGALLSGGWIAGSILFPLRRSRKPGFRAGAGLGGLLFINGVISLFRVDPAPILIGLRWETWFSLLFICSLIGLYFYQRMKASDEKTTT